MLWKDRVPTMANRKKITFEDETLGTKYATVEYADEPTEQGTPLNRANMLKGFNNFVCGVFPTRVNGSVTIDLGFEPYYIMVTAYGRRGSGVYVGTVATYCNGEIIYTGENTTDDNHYITISVSGTTLTVTGVISVDIALSGGNYIAFKHPAFE